MPPKLYAACWLLFVSAVWGGAFVFMKVAMEDITPLYFVCFRFLLAALIMIILCGKRLKSFNKKLFFASLWTGIPLALGLILQTVGLEQTTVANTAFISGLYVIFVPLLAAFGGKRPQKSQIFLVCVSVLGLLIFSGNQNFRMSWGDFLILLSALAFAWQLLAVEHHGNRHSSLLLAFGQILVAAIVCSLAAVLAEPVPTFISQSVLISLLYCGIFSTALAFLLQIRAQRLIPAEEAALVVISEALFGAYFGYWLLGETFSDRQLVGAVIIISSLVGAALVPFLRQRYKRKRHKQAEAHFR